MKAFLRITLALTLCLILSLLLIPGAFAEGSDSIRYDSHTIVGFDTSDFPQTIDLDHKYALIRLREQFPTELTVYLGGTVSYETGADGVRSIAEISGYDTQRVSVEWVCLENYDEDLDVFHFVPALNDYALADSLSLPVIRVNILGDLPFPDLPKMPSAPASPFAVSEHAIYGSSEDPGISYYNGYADNKLPAVRNQNPYGSCWAFSTIAAIEADLIHDGAADTSIDLSELHLAYFTYHNYYDEKGCNEGDNIVSPTDYLNLGGSPSVAAASLSNMVGPVPEAVVPYSKAYSYAPDPATRGERDFGTAQLTGAYQLDPTDINATKNAILAHGAVSTFVNIYDSSSDPRYYYSSEYNSFYNPVSKDTNHVITLVGWDDSFSRNKFRRGIPDGDGAWLVRNSWGEQGYDFSGYFWMSYYDKSITDEAYAFDAQPGQYDHCYAYASIPSSSYFYGLPSSSVFSQVFQIDGGEEIRAIGFDNPTANSTVSFTLTCGNRSVTVSQYCEYPGYHLIPLSEPLPVASQSEVTASFTYPGAGSNTVYVENSFTYNGVRFNASRKSDGLMLNGSLLGNGYDGFIKLFTNDSNAGLAIDETNFPDPAFRAYVAANFDTDGIDGVLSDEEIAAVTFIDVSYNPNNASDPSVSVSLALDQASLFSASGESGAGLQDNPRSLVLSDAAAFSAPDDTGVCTDGPVKSLKGIEYFTALKTLSCYGNQIAELDLSHNTELDTLACGLWIEGVNYGNKLSSLDLSNNKKLRFFACDGNLLKTLDLSANTELEMLNCIGNELKSLIINKSPKLAWLYCWDNKLTGLDISENLNLEYLDCGINALTSLSVAANTKLKELSCYNNAITALNVAGNTALEYLDCTQNQLTTLVVRNHNALKELYCSRNNNLEFLLLSGCGSLEYLYCFGNNLSSLDVTGCTALLTLDCSGNALQSLDISRNSMLQRLWCADNELSDLDVSQNGALLLLSCYNNSLSRLDVTGNTALRGLACNGNDLKVLNISPCAVLTQLISDLSPEIKDGVVRYMDNTENDTFRWLLYDEAVLLITPDMTPGFVLPAALTRIEDGAFAEIPNLITVYIPNTVTYIDPNAFGNIGELYIFGQTGSAAETFAQSSSAYTFIPAA